MSSIKCASFASILFYLCLAQPQAFADPLYNVTALSLGTSPAQITGLNNLGQLVGYLPASGSDWDESYAFTYDGSPGGSGTVTPLGGSTAPTFYPGVRDSAPIAINDSGQIIGLGNPGAYSAPNGTPVYYYLYSNRQTTALNFDPVAFNNAGQIAGVAFTPATLTTAASDQPVLYNSLTGSTQTLTATGLNSSTPYPAAINDSGQMVVNAVASPSNPNNIAFLISGGSAVSLGGLGGNETTANAINDNGQVVGSSELTGNLISHAFEWINGKMTDLGAPPGFPKTGATSINALGQIVGYAFNASGNLSNGFLYSNGVMTNLNSLISPTSGWTITSAIQINNLGQILAVAINGTSEGEVLLTPSDLSAPAAPQYFTITPEPSSLTIYGLVFAGLVLRFRPRSVCLSALFSRRR